MCGLNAIVCRRLRLAVAATTLLVTWAGSADSNAAIITYSASAPTLGAAGLSNATAGTGVATKVTEAFANFGVNSYVAGDQSAKGQTFTTGNSPAGYKLNAFTYRLPGYTSDNTFFRLDGTGSSTFIGRVITPGSASQTFETIVGVTPLATETAKDLGATGSPGAGFPGANGGPGTYVTFTFTTPVTLAANTLYGFDLSSNGTGGAGEFFETLGTNNQAAYSGGTAYASGGGGAAGGDYAVSTGDRVFYANITVVPEPASLLALAGIVGTAVSRRRNA